MKAAEQRMWPCCSDLQLRLHTDVLLLRSDLAMRDHGDLVAWLPQKMTAARPAVGPTLPSDL